MPRKIFIFFFLLLQIFHQAPLGDIFWPVRNAHFSFTFTFTFTYVHSYAGDFMFHSFSLRNSIIFGKRDKTDNSLLLKLIIKILIFWSFDLMYFSIWESNTYFFCYVSGFMCFIERETRTFILRLRAVERVTLLRFLFGLHSYWPKLDFAFFILE